MERMLGTPPIQHPDVFFAQKASSCVKAAGMDPRQMDLRRFYELAAVISTRAYLGIYKESPVGLISEPQNDDDLISNAHKIINGLISKTNDRNLMEISGRDIMLGSRRAVGILVNVLYSEGNRLWLLKLNAAEERSRRAAFDKYDLDSNRDVCSLLSDIPKKTSFYGVGTRDQTNPIDGMENDAIALFDGQHHSIIDVDDGISRTDTFSSSDIKTDSDGYNYRSGYPGLSHIAGLRKKRASSAPSRSKTGPRGRIARAQAAAVDRLFSAGKGRDKTTLKISNPRNSGNSNLKGADKGDVLPYTYDMKSGRKIVLNKAYLDSVVRQRNIEAIGNIKKLSEIGGGKSDDILPPVPIRAEWPGKSTGASVDKWLKRMTASNTDDNSSFLRPQIYDAYQLMEKLDMIFSVEHCFNCAHHSVALRHDAKEYLRNANESLRVVAQLAYECGVCTRVGVTRMRARISSKCKHTDADSRIGACEVQVAYKDVNGVIQTDVLYSKLHSRRWPLRIVMEKRFRSFILQNKVAAYPPSTNPHGLQIGLVQSYPTDFIKWEDTLQSDPDWTFSSGRDPLAVDLNCNFEKVLSAEETSLNVQWVYDARLFSHIFDASIPTLKSSPPLPGATDILKPSRPQTASSLRPCPVNRASIALAKLNAKSPLNSPRNLITMAEKISLHIDPKLDDSRSSNVRSYAHVLQGLRDITSQRIRSGGDLEHIIPYHVGVLIKRGVIVAETVSCCALLRQSLIAASFSTNTQSGPSVTPERVQANFLSLFESLDYKGLGFLNVIDIDTILTLIQSRRSSDQALRLVILSLDTNGSGKISFRQFFDFICHHDGATDTSLLVKNRPVNQDMGEETVDELGVVWMQIMMHLHEHEHSAGAVVDTDGGMQAMTDDLYASAVSHGAAQEEGICAQKNFISVFEKYGLMSILSKDNITLLFRVFGIEERKMMNINAFIFWLQAEGVDMTSRQSTPLIAPIGSPLVQKINAQEREEIYTASFKKTVHDPSPDCKPSKISFNKITMEGKANSQLIRENVEICVTICNKTFVAASGIVSKGNANILTYNMNWDTVEVTENAFLDACAALVVTVKSSEEGIFASGSVELKEFRVPIGSAFIVSLLVKNTPSPRGYKSRSNLKDSDADQSVKVTLYGTVQDKRYFDGEEYSEKNFENSSRVLRGNLFTEGNICHSAPSTSSGLPEQFHEIHTGVISEVQDSTEISRNGSLRNVEKSPTVTDHFLNHNGMSGKDIPTIVLGLDIVTKPNNKIVRENIEGVKGERRKSEGSIENPMYVLANNHSVVNENFKKEKHLTESSSSRQEEVVYVEQGAKESDMVLMITSVGTTQADEDNEDDYEVDFEDFVED